MIAQALPTARKPEAITESNDLYQNYPANPTARGLQRKRGE